MTWSGRVSSLFASAVDLIPQNCYDAFVWVENYPRRDWWQGSKISARSSIDEGLVRTSTVRVHHSLVYVISPPVPFTLLANQTNAKAVAGGNAGSRLAENIDKKVMTGCTSKANRTRKASLVRLCIINSASPCRTPPFFANDRTYDR